MPAVVVNAIRNPAARTNATDWTSSIGASGGAASIARVTGQTLPVVPGQTAATGAIIRQTWTTASTAVDGGPNADTGPGAIPSASVVRYASIWVRTSISQRVYLIVQNRTDANAAVGGSPASSQVVIPANTWTRLAMSWTSPATATRAVLSVRSVAGTGGVVWPLNATFDAVYAQVSETDVPYYDGATTSTSTVRYGWAGTTDASFTTATPWLDVSLVPSGSPNPAQIVLTGVPAGVGYEVVGTTSDGSTWPIPGGVGTSTGDQVVLVDNRAALNAPVTYSATWSGVTRIALNSVTVTDPDGCLLQSLDGQTVVRFWWLEDGLPRTPVVRTQAFDVPGRLRPPMRFTSGGDGGGSMRIRTSRENSATLTRLLRSGRPLILRTNGNFRDLPAVEILAFVSAPNRLSPFAAIDTRRTDRLWDLDYILVDDPEPSVALSAWTWDDFDAAMSTRTWADFDALFAPLKWTDFDTYPWGQL